MVTTNNTISNSTNTSFIQSFVNFITNYRLLNNSLIILHYGIYKCCCYSFL